MRRSVVVGKVIEVETQQKMTEAASNSHRVWYVDHHGDECALQVAQNELPSIGDEIKILGGKALWTPSDKRFLDRPIDRVGYAAVTA